MHKDLNFGTGNSSMDEGELPKPSLSQALSQVLYELRSKWVRDFLFASSPLHINHLLSPALMSNAIHFSSCAINPFPTSLAPMVTGLEIKGDMLFSPMFTADQTTLGIGILSAKPSSDVTWMSKTFQCSGWRSNLRFVHRSRRRKILAVYEIPHEEAFVMTLTCAESPTVVYHTCCIVKSEPLRRASLYREEGIDIEHMTVGLRFVQTQIHTRWCVLCHSAPMAQCGCTPRENLPLHPFDSNYFSSSMNYILTPSQGIDGTILYASGKQTYQKVGGARLRVRHANDQSKMKDLTAWSLTEYFKTVTPALPLAETNIEPVGGFGDEGIEESNEAIFSAQTQTKRMENEADDLLRPFLSAEDNYNDFAEFQHALQNFGEPLSNIDVLGHSGVAAAPSRVSGSAFHMEMAFPDLGTLQVTRSNASQTQTHPPLNPLPTNSAHPPGRATSPERHAKMLRIQQRMRKNRLAARRSNEKRKIERQTLTLALTDIRKEHMLLREREAELRKENKILRKRLEEGGFMVVWSVLPASQ